MGSKAADITFIGDADSVLGFGALGVQTIVPSTAEDAVIEFRRLVQSGRVRVIMVTEAYIDVLEEEIAAIACKPLPAVVILPGTGGSRGRGADVIRHLVARAVGVDLMAGEKE